MDEGRTQLAIGAVTLSRERPLRMAVATPGEAAALIDPHPRVSAVPLYSSPLSFDWRRNEPLAATPAPPAAKDA